MDETSSEKSTIPCVRDRNSGGCVVTGSSGSPPRLRARRLALPGRSPVRVRSAPRASRRRPARPWRARSGGRDRRGGTGWRRGTPGGRRRGSAAWSARPSDGGDQEVAVRSARRCRASPPHAVALASTTGLGAQHVASDPASTTRTTSTPARPRSSTAASPSALAVRTTARSPGRTAHRLINRRTAVDSSTPGSSLPSNTYGRSISPGATTRVLARTLSRRSNTACRRRAAGWLALDDREPVVVVAAGDDAVGHDLEVLVGLGRVDAARPVPPARRPAVAQVAAEPVLLLDQEHPGAGLGRGDRGRHPAGPPPATHTSTWA